MQADEIRSLFAYDRWATRRVLTVLDGLDPAVWTRTHVVGERGLGAILVHHLGASQRWRHAFQDTGESPGPNGSRYRRSTNCTTFGKPSGKLSTPGCPP
jgi:uncharacterized damage-inducible protein DinB